MALFTVKHTEHNTFSEVSRELWRKACFGMERRQKGRGEQIEAQGWMKGKMVDRGKQGWEYAWIHGRMNGLED